MSQENLDPNYAGEGIYRENILDHYKNPRNQGTLENPDIQHKELNPICGDQIQVTIKFNRSSIENIKFIGNGCAISQSSMSMLSEKVKGMEIEKIKEINKDDIVNMLSIPISPVRLKCALLGLDTIKNAIHIYQKYQPFRKKAGPSKI